MRTSKKDTGKKDDKYAESQGDDKNEESIYDDLPQLLKPKKEEESEDESSGDEDETESDNKKNKRNTYRNFIDLFGKEFIDGDKQIVTEQYKDMIQEAYKVMHKQEKEEEKREKKRKRKNKLTKKNIIIKNQPNRNNKEQFELKRDRTRTENKKKIQQMTQEEIEEKGILNPWGDNLEIQENWPNNNADERLRIISVNINGISHQGNYLEWEIILANMIDLQADIFVIQETKLDLTSGRVRDEILQAAKQFDKHMRIHFSASKQKPNKNGSPYKPGGTIIGVNGAWSGRIVSIKEPRTMDTLGRWTTCHMIGKLGKKTTIISLYRVCEQKHNIGSNTVYIQQQLDLEKQNNKICNPREAICKDLENYIQSLHEMGHTVILAGDANEDMRVTENNKMHNMLENAGMINIMEERRRDEKLPTTYDRGKKCLDLIARSKHREDGIVKAAGFLPFYQPFATDHRVAYVDLNAVKIFGKFKQDTTKQIYHTFHTNNTKKCDKYLEILECKMEEHRIFRKVDSMRQEIRKHIAKQSKNPENQISREESRLQLISRCKKMEIKQTELMKVAAKQTGRTRKYQKSYPYSTKLSQLGKALKDAKKDSRMSHLGMEQHTGLTIEEANLAVDTATKQLREGQNNATQLREEMLTDLAEKRARQWKVEPHQALKVLKMAEKTRTTFGKTTRAIKQQTRGTLRQIALPKPTTGRSKGGEYEEENFWERVDDPEQIMDQILRRNATHLLKSKDAITAKGPILEEIGWDAEKQGAEDILNGKIDPTQYEKAHSKFPKEATEFIRNMQKQGNHKGEQEMRWKFGKDQYNKLFNKTRESTACGPSGLHMSHWKAATERGKIAEVHAFFIWAAFTLGFAYERWQTSWHCMIQKKATPYIHKLRIVQIFEGDFNGGLKYLLGRKLMRHIVTNDLIEKDTYGSIPGRSAQEAMCTLQLLYDNHRIMKNDLAIIFNDADGCYDRIRPNMAEMAMRRVHLPKGIARAHTIAQRKMKHYIRTASGISEGYIKWNGESKKIKEKIHKGRKILEGNIGGIGQGGGGGPVAWIVIILIMIATFRKFAKGAIIIDPIGTMTIIIHILSYVDDNTIVRSLESTKTIQQILETLSKEVQSWQKILQVTGGDLSIDKCVVSIMKWEWFNGKARMLRIDEIPGNVTTISNGHKVELRRIEYNKSERQLGIRLALDGNFRQEFEYRKKQSESLGNRLYHSPMNSLEAYLVYAQYYRPMISYPLEVTTFTDNECDIIQSKFIHKLLPKLGLNRHTPRAIIFGPTTHGGIGFMDVKAQQIYSHLHNMKIHNRRMDQVGKSTIANINAMQIESGSALPILHQDPTKYNYMDNNTKMEYIWKKTHHLKIRIEIESWLPKSKYKNDTAIMDHATQDEIINSDQMKLHSINACRMYQGIIFISDMMIYNGESIQRYYVHTGGGTKRNTQLKFPRQPTPTRQQWEIWKQYIHRNFLQQGTKLVTPIILATNPKRHEESEIKSIINLKRSATGTLEDTFQQIHQNLKIICGNLRFPSDNGEQLINAMKLGNLVTATDGSLRQYDEDGTHAFVISEEGDMENTLEGHADSPKTDEMSSQTTEHFGLLSMVIMLKVLCTTHNITERDCKGCYIETYIDNAEVYKRSNNTNPKEYKLKHFAVPDYDLWMITNRIINSLPIAIKGIKIKAHQDKDTPIEELPYATRLNIYADHLTHQQRESDRIYSNKPAYKGQIYFIDNNNREITNVKKYVSQQHDGKTQTGRSLSEHYYYAKNWTQATQTMINWRALDKAIRTTQPIQRCKLAQMMHNWQNVGTQKQLIHNSDKKTYDTYNIGQGIQKCPTKCGKTEIPMHYMTCQDVTMAQLRDKEIKHLGRELRLIGTHPTIIRKITRRAKKLEDPTEDNNGNDNIDEIILQAEVEQNQIGWKEFFQGYTSQYWTTAQIEHYKEQKHKIDDILQWEKKFVVALQQYTIQIWKTRNEALHGKNATENKHIRLRQLKDKVEQLYEHKDRRYIPKTADNLFKRPKEQRLQQGITALETWTRLAEQRLNMHREAAAKITIHRWIKYKDDDEKDKNNESGT